MKKVLALTAGVLVALVPSGTAFAGELAPVPGKAYGNCKHSSAGGNPHTALLPEVGSGKGNGGLAKLTKSGAECAAPTEVPAPAPEEPTVPEEPTQPTEPPTEPTQPTEPTEPPAVPYEPGAR